MTEDAIISIVILGCATLIAIAWIVTRGRRK